MYLQTCIQNKIKVSTCRFKDLNQRQIITEHPELNVTWNDFNVRS